MPHFCLTMGVGTILEAKKLILLASGTKSEIVKRALEGPITSQVTAVQFNCMVEKLLWF